MPGRTIPLTTNELYHIYTKSIAEFKIFNTPDDCERIIDELSYYSIEAPPLRFSAYERLKKDRDLISTRFDKAAKIVEIIAYCIMPTHIHLILKGEVSKFTSLVLNSYSKYFNNKYKRKGPLWEGRFKNVPIQDDGQYLHLTRYIHLNPVTSYLVDDPINWKYSSYAEYLGRISTNDKICNFSQYFSMDPICYENFVKDRIAYQRELASIKNLTFD